MLWLRFRIAVKGGHSAYPHTGGSANKVAAALIQDLQAIEAMVPDEPASVRTTLDRPEVRKAADLSAGRRRRRGDAPRLGQHRHHPGRREDQHAAARLHARGRFPPAPGVSRAAVLARVAAIAARHPGTSFEELLPGGPEATCLRPDARDDGPSPAPRRRGLSPRRRSRSSASAAPTPASGGSRACRPSSTAARPPAWAASTRASASRSSIT